MIVYIDVIFLFNVLIDGILLWTTAWSRKLSFRWWRLALSAAIGGSYAILLFFPPLSFLYTFAVKFVLSLLMLLTAFGFGGLQHFVRNLGPFTLLILLRPAGLSGVCTFGNRRANLCKGF